MLPLLQRSGFDAVLLRADQRVDAAQRALRFFAGHYQGDVHETAAALRALARHTAERGSARPASSSSVPAPARPT